MNIIAAITIATMVLPITYKVWEVSGSLSSATLSLFLGILYSVWLHIDGYKQAMHRVKKHMLAPPPTKTVPNRTPNQKRKQRSAIARKMRDKK